MNLKSRLIRLEEKPVKIDLVQAKCRLRELIGKSLGLDLSQCNDVDFDGHIKTALKLALRQSGVVYGEDWTTKRLTQEFRRLLHRADRALKVDWRN